MEEITSRVEDDYSKHRIADSLESELVGARPLSPCRRLYERIVGGWLKGAKETMHDISEMFDYLTGR
ncbi:hypothetical protein HY638_04070 [Candidatus Woesearchaeota archaeon]|nr:hypothetical protein [Candidatus Woesearchaeota archaeon]